MEVPRHDGRVRVSRSRKDTSNKENICPSTARDSTSSELFRRRSPLPESFPRSPLQDITHIICPKNIWPDNQDPQADQQVSKKIRKDTSAEVCKANEMESRSSWKGLIACENVTSGATIVRIAETRKEDEISKPSTDIKAVANGDEANSNMHNEENCLNVDEISNETISPPNSGTEGEQSVQTKEQTMQTGQLGMQVRNSQQKHSSAEDGGDSLKRDICGRRVQTTVLKENSTKRPQQSTQPKKKSSLLMFR